MSLLVVHKDPFHLDTTSSYTTYERQYLSRLFICKLVLGLEDSNLKCNTLLSELE